MPFKGYVVHASVLVASVVATLTGCSPAGPELISRTLDDGSVEIDVCEGVPITLVAFADPSDDPGIGSTPLIWRLTGRSTGAVTIDAPTVPKGFSDEGYQPEDRATPHSLTLSLASTDAIDLGTADLGDVSGRVAEWPTVRITRTTCS